MNAKAELEQLIKRANVPLKCAEITLGEVDYNENTTSYILVEGYSEVELAEFFEKLNFEYDDGFGGQELFGTVWFMDGTWADRGEYDGSEWWDYHKCPEVSNKCKRGTI